ncbi:unnamed protein product [Penicillium pancosmium]
MMDIAKIIRSKNSGPFEMTFDIMFDTTEAYTRVKNPNNLANQRVMSLYHLKPEDIIVNTFFEPALAWKCTIRRPWGQGTVGERDTLVTQQHGTLLTIAVPPAPGSAATTSSISITGVSTAPQDGSYSSAKDSVDYLWLTLGLPAAALKMLHHPGQGLGLPSSFKIAHIAQASIGLSVLSAAQIHAHRSNLAVHEVTVPLQHAVIKFRHPMAMCASMAPVHRDGALALVGCEANATHDELASKIRCWCSVDLEAAALENRLVISAPRSFAQWDVLPQARRISNFPITLRKLCDGPVGLPSTMQSQSDKAFRDLRVLELSRVIAAPLRGKKLAAHGVDVLWDQNELSQLLEEAHVSTQGFRPGGVADRGFSSDTLSKRFQHRNIICANMSAYCLDGPWSGKRGFDLLIQTCPSMNISEAEHFSVGEAARRTPCQVLDHAGGYFLAAGITAALYKQATEGGSWQVDVSLAGVMKYLRSLGQFEGKAGFQTPDFTSTNDVPEEYGDRGNRVWKEDCHSTFCLDPRSCGWLGYNA